MSLCTLEATLSRIRAASAASPVAVFTAGGEKPFEVMFASTYHTQKRIDREDPCFVGTFDNTMLPQVVRDELRGYVADKWWNR